MSTNPDHIEIIPLSSSQIPFYTGQRLHPDAPIYNMPFAFDIKADINVELFKLAFQILINKTDILRTLFVESEGEPYQRILKAYDYEIPVLDFTTNTEVETSAWMHDKAAEILSFDKPLFAAYLLQKGSNHYIWYINQHHLITDAWACTVLYRNCIDIYKSLEKEDTIDPTPYPSYRDYVEDVHSEKSMAKRTRVSDYWDVKYKNLPGELRFYGTRKKETTTHSTRIKIPLGVKRSEQIRTLAGHKELRSWTPDMTYLNVFSSLLYIYLYRIGQQEKISIDLPFHNRPTPQDKETIGAFIEMYPFAIELSDDHTFLDVYKSARNESNEVFKNVERGASSHQSKKASNVVLNYINAGFQAHEGFDTSYDWIHSGHVDPIHHLRLQVYDFDRVGEFEMFFDFNTNVFDKKKMQGATTHFLNIVDHFLSNIDQPIGECAILTDAEKDRLKELSTGESKVEKPLDFIVERIRSTAQRHPQTVGIIHSASKDYSYTTLDAASDQFANYLNVQNIGEGDTIALHTYRSPVLVVSMLGAIKAGVTFIPISANTPIDRVRYMLQDGDVKLLIYDTGLSSENIDSDIQKISIDDLQSQLEHQPIEYTRNIESDHITYMMYTSGSTGNPKGVNVSLSALNNYLDHAESTYLGPKPPQMPLYSMIGFDLTITSIFLPLLAAGTIHVYKEKSIQGDLSIVDVIHDNQVNILKLTPSHWNLISDFDYAGTKLQTLIVGGEAFQPRHLVEMRKALGADVNIYNEYGPTEATVGCVVHELDPEKKYTQNVPIGLPIRNMEAYILDKHMNQVPLGVAGQLFLSGTSLAQGYQNNDALTNEKFVNHIDRPNKKMYATGDFCSYSAEYEIEYLGRKDEQLKIRGVRVELGEIESVISNLDMVESCAVTFTNFTKKKEEKVIHCKQCGLPSNFPDSTFDENQICNLCNSFENYQKNAEKYFKTEDELKVTLNGAKRDSGKYDCMMLLSGGKDSSYALGQLVDMGLNVLAFTLDNGYISEEAKANVRRIVKDLNVDHVFGQTEAMNAIFVDSLRNFSNVCNGCFKVLYTLSTQVALEKGIPYIVTGLSRGQFFETRLTEELFWNEDVDIQKIDDIILNARKAYHRIDDAIAHYLDTDIFQTEEVFEKVQFLDFYRYCDVSMDEMMQYLDTHLPWIRPSDTGRSTNCLINQVGIYVHKKKKGFSNYAFPYSWDVRLGHKERDTALEEINEELNEKEIFKIMSEIGYLDELENTDEYKLTLHYTGEKIDEEQLKIQLRDQLPIYLIPTHFVQLEALPLSKNGKIDRKSLQRIVQEDTSDLSGDLTFTEPEGEIESLLTQIWQDVIGIERISTSYNFLDIGGNSLAAIRINSRIAEMMNLEIPIASIFDNPTIKELAAYIENRIMELLNEV